MRAPCPSEEVDAPSPPACRVTDAPCPHVCSQRTLCLLEAMAQTLVLAFELRAASLPPTSRSGTARRKVGYGSGDAAVDGAPGRAVEPGDAARDRALLQARTVRDPLEGPRDQQVSVRRERHGSDARVRIGLRVDIGPAGAGELEDAVEGRAQDAAAGRLGERQWSAGRPIPSHAPVSRCLVAPS
jgi:hypothetical protein